MTRKELLTLSPRLARQSLARVITLYLEPELHMGSIRPDRYRVTADCSLCNNSCVISFCSPGRLSCVSVEKIAATFYSLCHALDFEASVSVVLDGPKVAISAAVEEV